MGEGGRKFTKSALWVPELDGVSGSPKFGHWRNLSCFFLKMASLSEPKSNTLNILHTIDQIYLTRKKKERVGWHQRLTP